MKIRPVIGGGGVAELFHTDGRTDMTKLIVFFFFCNCFNTPKNIVRYLVRRFEKSGAIPPLPHMCCAQWWFYLSMTLQQADFCELCSCYSSSWHTHVKRSERKCVGRSKHICIALGLILQRRVWCLYYCWFPYFEYYSFPSDTLICDERVRKVRQHIVSS